MHSSISYILFSTMSNYPELSFTAFTITKLQFFFKPRSNLPWAVLTFFSFTLCCLFLPEVIIKRGIIIKKKLKDKIPGGSLCFLTYSRR